MIRIEGFGLTGAIIANALFALEIPFEWYDNNSPYNAWGASTGCIYPSGEASEQKAYETWGHWMQARSPLTERGNYHFAAQSPPYGAKMVYKRLSDNLCLGSLPSYHLNVYEFVMRTRAKFIDFYAKEAQGGKRIITHSARNYYLWGWSIQAPVVFPAPFDSSQRVSFVQRLQRYQLNYIYPCPNTDFYYLGTSTIQQKTPKKRDGTKDVERFSESLPQGIKINWKESKGVSEGWRPVSQSPSIVSSERFVLAGQSGNGVRLAPLYLREILDWIGYNGELPNPLL